MSIYAINSKETIFLRNFSVYFKLIKKWRKRKCQKAFFRHFCATLRLFKASIFTIMYQNPSNTKTPFLSSLIQGNLYLQTPSVRPKKKNQSESPFFALLKYHPGIINIFPLRCQLLTKSKSTEICRLLN